MSDAFSVNNTSAKLDYPVGLMTVDELSYAGGGYKTVLTAPYAWYYTNANGESITGNFDFWTISPMEWFNDGFALTWGVNVSKAPGILHIYRVNEPLAVRPSVSLSSCNLISRGDGSPENPYEIYTGSEVCE